VNVVDRLRDVEVFDTDGRQVRLGNLWHERAVVLLFEYVSREAGDHPDPRQVLTALDVGSSVRRTPYTWLRSISSAGYGER
jgi:hypothetical protein